MFSLMVMVVMGCVHSGKFRVLYTYGMHVFPYTCCTSIKYLLKKNKAGCSQLGEEVGEGDSISSRGTSIDKGLEFLKQVQVLLQLDVPTPGNKRPTGLDLRPCSHRPVTLGMVPSFF